MLQHVDDSDDINQEGIENAEWNIEEAEWNP